jgi:hypothetical protein
MKPFSRRDLLRALGTCSALAALPSFLRGAVQPPAQTGGTVLKTQVNVLLHGMFVIDYTKTAVGHVFLYSPDVSPEHVYLGGNWLSEQKLTQNGHYKLLPNGTGGKAVPDGHHCAVFTPSQVSPNYSLAYCSVQLPVPDQIFYLRPISGHGMKFFTGPVAPTTNPSSLPTLTAFSYTFDQGSSPIELQQLGWTPAVNLHLWASPPKMPSNGHLSHAVDKMAQLLGVAGKLSLDPNLQIQSPPPPDGHPLVVGLSSEEEEDLVERHGRFIHVMDGSLHNCFSAFVY